MSATAGMRSLIFLYIFVLAIKGSVSTNQSPYFIYNSVCTILYVQCDFQYPILNPQLHCKLYIQNTELYIQNYKSHLLLGPGTIPDFSGPIQNSGKKGIASKVIFDFQQQLIPALLKV